jgi:hypothetical protein
MTQGQDSFTMLYNGRRTILSFTIAAQIMDGESSVNMLSTSIPRLDSIPEGRLPRLSAPVTHAMNVIHRDRDIAARIMDGESSLNLLSTSNPSPHLRPADKSPHNPSEDVLEYINVSLCQVSLFEVQFKS